MVDDLQQQQKKDVCLLYAKQIASIDAIIMT